MAPKKVFAGERGLTKTHSKREETRGVIIKDREGPQSETFSLLLEFLFPTSFSPPFLFPTSFSPPLYTKCLKSSQRKIHTPETPFPDSFRTFVITTK